MMLRQGVTPSDSKTSPWHLSFKQYAQLSGQPMKHTKVVTPWPSVPIRNRSMAKIGAFIQLVLLMVLFLFFVIRTQINGQLFELLI